MKKKLEKLLTSLKTKKLTIALAESCTAGYASYLLTKTPGASRVFKGSTIVYSLDAKNKLFKIGPSLLRKTQGVSSEIALILAKEARKKFNADIGASIVGFAGPQVKKGVKAGTVFIALSYKSGSTIEKVIIKGNRDMVRKKASSFLVNLIYERFANSNID